MPYEITLELRRDGTPYGVVGERCGWFLSRFADAVAQARDGGGEGTGPWPDPDDRFPEEKGNGELFAFRYMSRSGAAHGGELRCQLRTIPVWVGGHSGGERRAAGEWRLTRRAFVEAWGSTGVGLRAVLTSSELADFVNALVAEAESRFSGFVPDENAATGAGRWRRRR
ncbi:hypothetical protein [Sinosporangium siamense]|nr:hypothetical protein [Sinosporangium siamense]